MENLTAFLLNEDSSLPFDSFNDNVLQNLPHQPGQYDILDAIVPFQFPMTLPATKGTGVKAQQDVSVDGAAPMPWEAAQPVLGSMAAAPPIPTAAPAFLADAGPLAAAVGGDPALQPSTSSGSSGAHQLKEDPDFSKLQERIQKQKEKNARNQRQFRKRAKERAMRIEEQVQELSVKLAQLEGEKAGLAARNRALEAALVSAKTAVAQLGPGVSLASVVAAAAEDGGAELPAAPVTLRVREGSPVTLSVQQLQGLPWPDLAHIWKEYVNASAMCLVTAGPAGEARLAEMMADVMALMRTIAVHNPLLIHQHFSRRMDGAPHAPPSPQQPPPDFYDQILAALDLSAEQREQMLAHRYIKLASLARLVQERRDLQARLQECNEDSADFRGTLQGMCSGFGDLLDVAQRLQHNVAQLHRSLCLFMGQTWGQVLTPVQAGTFLVQAFPWAPDMLALANATAQQDKAPSVAEIFAEILGPKLAAAAPNQAA